MKEQRGLLSRAGSFAAGAALIIGATVFSRFLLEHIHPSSGEFMGIPLSLIGALGLALFALGIGSLGIVSIHLAFKINLLSVNEARILVKNQLVVVAQVFAGLCLLFVYGWLVK
jgi:hypothetical protein